MRRLIVIVVFISIIPAQVKGIWQFRTPRAHLSPGENFALPVYATTRIGIRAFQVMVQFCRDWDSLKIWIDSVTWQGHGVVTTIFDTLPTGWAWQGHFTPFDSNGYPPTPPGITGFLGGVVDFLGNGTAPLMDDIICVFWEHIEDPHNLPMELPVYTIKLHLDSTMDCPPWLQYFVGFFDVEAISQIADSFIDGTITVSNAMKIQESENSLPKRYGLGNILPNPFRDYTEIEYMLPRDTNLKIEIYNTAGYRVKRLVESYESAGYKSIIWDGTDDTNKRLSRGVYFCRLKDNDFIAIKRLILLR